MRRHTGLDNIAAGRLHSEWLAAAAEFSRAAETPGAFLNLLDKTVSMLDASANSGAPNAIRLDTTPLVAAREIGLNSALWVGLVEPAERRVHSETMLLKSLGFHDLFQNFASAILNHCTHTGLQSAQFADSNFAKLTTAMHRRSQLHIPPGIG